MRIALCLVWLVGVAYGAAEGLVNLSVRGPAAGGAEALAAGFVIAGSAPKTVLVRGAGPALSTLGVPGVLAQPRLEVFRESVSIANNQGWDAVPDGIAVRNAMRAVGAFEFPAGSRDAALLLVLTPGNYTAHVTPAGTSSPG